MKKKIINSVKNNKILTVILLLAVLLRFIGIYPGYHPYHSDEGMSYSSAIEMIRNLNIDPTRYDYPSLIPIINMIIYVIFFIPLFIIKSLIFSPEDLPTKGGNLIQLWQQIVIQNQQTMVLFWGRFITAFLGVSVVLLVYLAVKKLFKDYRIGLVAAFLTTVNFRQVLNSHLGLPDIYNAFFLLLAIYLFSVLIKNPTFKSYLAAGISVGLFFSTKLQIFALPTFIITHTFVVWSTTNRKILKNLIVNFLTKKFLLSLVLIPIVILLINPYHLIKWEEFQADESYNLLKYRLGANMLNIFSISYLYHIGIGKIISFLVILGTIVGLFRHSRSTLILLSVILPFLYFFFYYSGGGYYTRNFITITPLLLIFAAIFLVVFWDYVGKMVKVNQKLISFFLIISVIFVSWEQLKNSLTSSYYFTKPWGFKLANVWAQDNIGDGTKIVSHPWDNYPRDKNLEIITFNPSSLFSLAEMQEEEAEYGFINMDWLTLGSYWWMNRDLKNSFWEKPDNILSNTYSAIVAQELAYWAVAHFVKPWQAPDMNFLIVKIPQVKKPQNLTPLAKFNFNKEDALSSWSITGQKQKFVIDSDNGNLQPGSLKILSGAHGYPVLWAASSILPVNDKKTLVIEGFLKTSAPLSKNERDGFLRVDFYDEKNVSLRTFISARVYNTTGWVKKELIIFPPLNARSMTVGVQINNYNEFWFDDISVYESKDEMENPRTKPPYIDYKIPDDILFPYSQGGL